LRENPGHLDAMADLLKEARRRALHRMLEGVDKDLDDETDLRTWGMMASETDKVFSGPWLGADIKFFRLDQVQPEKHSKLMRAVFRRHIPKIESAILLEPTNATLWNIWAWMAQGIGDYNWGKFINGIEPALFSPTAIYKDKDSVPSTEAAAWLVGEASERKDWNTVIKLATVAKYPITLLVDKKTEWTPEMGNRGSFLAISSFREGHPIKTVYAPHIEALLRLGDIDGANSVYDEMIRTEGKASATVAADVARSLGMEDLAKLWRQGEQVNPVQSITMDFDSLKGTPFILTSKIGDALYSKLVSINRKLSLGFSFFSLGSIEPSPRGLGWKADEDRWALVSSDRRILFQDTSVPDADAFLAILQRLGIKSDIELYREYIEEHGSAPGIELSLAFRIISGLSYDKRNANSPDNIRNEALAREAAGHLNSVRLENPDVLVNLPQVGIYHDPTKALMSSMSKPLLSNIESLLERKPSAENLWQQWIFWNKVGELGGSLESIVDRLKPSPLSDGGILGMPSSVIEEYFQECKKNGSWSKVAALLKSVWDREYSRIVEPGDTRVMTHLDNTTKDTLGDAVGVHLIESYLQDGKPGEADEMFRAVLECGGKFRNISKIVKLAKAMGHEKLAAQWETAAKAGK